jgi:putative membrane protein
MRSEPRALHPMSVLLGMPLALLVRSIVLPAAAVLASGLWASVPLVVGVSLAWIVGRVLTWQRFRFSFDGDVVRVESGVLQRTHRSVDVARMQQVEIDRPLVQRLLGVATLRIETAGADDEPEIELRVLAERDAVELRDAVRAGRDRARAVAPESGAPSPSSADAGPRTVIALSLGRVALAAVSGAQLLIAPALVGGALQLTELRLDELVVDVTGRIVALSSTVGAAVLALVAVLTTLAVMVATTLIVGVVRDGRFRIERVGDDLVVRRGLLGTRESTLPLGRIQVVRVVSNPLRRALGMATVRIHSAGSSGGGERRRVTVPLLTVEEVAVVVTELLPSADRLPTVQGHPRAALRRAIVRRLIPVVTSGLGGALVVMLLGPSLPDPITAPRLLAVLLAALAVAIGLGVAEGMALAHATDGRSLVVRHGALMRTSSIVPLARLQAVTHAADWFQRRLGLATVVAHVAGPGGDVGVIDAAGSVALRLRADLAAAAAGEPEPLSPRAGASPDRR